MKQHVLGMWKSDAAIKDMANYIYTLICGEVKKKGSMILMSERARQFFTWGANDYRYIKSVCGCYGLGFQVSGLKFKGRVRIWYNPSSDYFDVEFLRTLKDEVVESYEDIDLTQLHNVLHRFIEREDDPEV